MSLYIRKQYNKLKSEFQEEGVKMNKKEKLYLENMLNELESECTGDEKETYTTGYRNGHRNGQIELLKYILNVPCGEKSNNEEER